MVGSIFVLGGAGGEPAGWLAALVLKSRLPGTQVLLAPWAVAGGARALSASVYAPLFHRHVMANRGEMWSQGRPMVSLGTRYEWGKRPRFHVAPGLAPQQFLSAGFRKPAGFFYGDTDFDDRDVWTALLARDRLAARQAAGPLLPEGVAYHFDMDPLAALLESLAKKAGVQVLETPAMRVLAGERGVQSLVLTNGQTLAADLYVDASGAESVLLGGALGERLEEAHLPCDRIIEALVPRKAGQALRPCAMSQTLEAGWTWQVELEQATHCQMMYGSQHMSHGEARAAFQVAFPAFEGEAAIVRLACGRRARRWVDNVIAVGTAAGVLPPPHAMGPDLVMQQTAVLAQTLLESESEPSASQMVMLNEHFRRQYNALRGLTALQLKFNDRLATPFWNACREHVELGAARAMVEFFQENGPAGYWNTLLVDPADVHPLETYWTMLLGLQVPHQAMYQPTAAEAARWREHCERNRHAADAGMTAEETMAYFQQARTTR